MSTTAVLLLLLLHTASAAQNRRILHEPFFPLYSSPPAQPPTPTPTPPTPKYPFSTATPDNSTGNSPFFPFYPSPPPPPPPPSTPSTFASFPANISSLTLPQSSKSKPSSKLVIVAVAAVIAAVAVVSLAAFLHFRNKRRRSNNRSPPFKSTPGSSTTNSTTTSHAPPPATNHRVNSHVPKLQRPSQTSSEFLYLGTLVNSHAPLVSHKNNNSSNARNASSSNNNTGSPELRPLPPLSGPQKSNLSYRNADVAQISRDDDDDEEFYSPKGSRGTSTIATGSASGRDFTAVGVRNVNGSSSTYSSSPSGSLERSVSLSLSPEHSSSSRNSIPKSPDLIELQHLAPLEGDPQYVDSFNRESSSSPLFPSPSPPSSSERYSARMSQESSSPKLFRVWDDELGDSLSNLHSQVQVGCLIHENLPQSSVERFPTITSQKSSSPRISDVSDHNVDDSHSNMNSSTQISSPQMHHCVDVAPPPPPPPPPPPRQQPRKTWDSPKTPTPHAKKPAVAPPSLVKPFGAVAMDSSTLISPMKLPSNDESNVGSHMEEMEKSAEEAVDSNKEELDNDLKPKLKPLHWDKVRANSDKEMVWDQLKCSSFKLNEEMIETLFVVNKPNPKPSPKEAMRWQVLPSPSGDNINKVLDPKKSQNIAILLRALNVTIEEVCDGLLEGNTDTLSTDLLESLLKMAPTKEEERKLKEHKEDSPVKLGAAERFLKAVLDVPHAFKRLEAMLYVSNFESEVEYLKKSFVTLEAACEELRTSRMFLKLLEAVLKTGNRMNVGTNRGDAQAFKLDTLLKLVDVKGADGKTTLLHFVVQEIIRTEGARMSENSNSALNDEAKCRKIGLQVVSGLSNELSNVKKAATMDAEVLSSDISELSNGIKKIIDAIKLTEEHSPSDESGSSRFSESMNGFLKRAEEELIKIQAQESVASSLVKEVTEYFHGNSTKEEAHPFRIFLVVRDFLGILDRVCKEVGMINERTVVSSASKFPVPVNPLLQQVSGGFFSRPQFTAFKDDER